MAPDIFFAIFSSAFPLQIALFILSPSFVNLPRKLLSYSPENEKGELLIQKRSEKKFRSPGKWAKTGGQVDSGESPKEAIIREIKEELGVEIQKDHVLSEGMILKDNEKKLKEI